MEFFELHEKYAPEVHRSAQFLSANAALAEDLTSETFVRALIGKDDIRVDTVKAYLLAIVRNLCVDSLRGQRRLVALDALPVPMVTAPVVKVRVHRARTKLRTIFRKENS